MSCNVCKASKEYCRKCRRNPVYAQINGDYFMEYVPACPLGYTDCISDPAYIKHHYPEWYTKLYGDKTPEEVIDCDKNLMKEEYNGEIYYSCNDYDNEDK